MASVWTVAMQNPCQRSMAAAVAPSGLPGLASASGSENRNGDLNWKGASVSSGSGRYHVGRSCVSYSDGFRFATSGASSSLGAAAAAPAAAHFGAQALVAAAAAAAASATDNTRCGAGGSSMLSSSSPLAGYPFRMYDASSDFESVHVEASALISKPGIGGGGGTGLLERPGLDLNQDGRDPQTENGGDLGKESQRRRNSGGDRYRVLLLDHDKHTESQVAKVLPSVVPSVSPDEARKCFLESRECGFAIVLVCVKEHAEFYAQMMVRSGLRSTIAPDGDVL